MATDNTKQQQDKLPLPDMAVHNVAKLFPILPEKELKELREDIKANGIKVPILVNKTGDTILDGRNRWMIARELRFTLDQVPMQTFQGTDEDIPAEILSRNVFRRHLSDDQRISLLAKVLAPKLEEEANVRKTSAQFGAESTSETTVPENSTEPGKVAQHLAKQGKVSQHKAEQALKVNKAGDIAAVIAGKKSLHDAASGLPKKRRTGRTKQPPTLEDQVWKSYDRLMKNFDLTEHPRVKEILRGFLDKSVEK